MQKLLITFLAFFIGLTCYSQSISNVEAEYINGKVYVNYNLTTNTPQYITLLYSNNEGVSYKSCKSVSGDVNIQTSGKKQIVWDSKTDVGEMQFDSYILKVDFAEFIGATETVEFCEMIFVEGGTFAMGCTSEQTGDCEDDEKPAHDVTLSSYYIGKYQVTQKQWQEIMGDNPSNFKNCEDCPVENISWNDIQEFIRKLNAKTGRNYRLPTEAEWEFAARGGNKTKGYKYSGSNNVGEVAWYNVNSNSKTHSVGQKKANELWIYDMSGNVWEWCSDWYDAYSSSSHNNPKGPSSGLHRVFRGCGWYNNAKSARVTDRRGGGNPDLRSDNIGFRLARSAK